MRKDEKTADEEQQRTDEKKQADEKKRRTDEILKAALDYAKKGYRVFPVRCGQLWKGKPNYKISLISDWDKNATTDEEQIRGWFGNGKPSNIGLVCDGLIVIDLDAKKEGSKKESGFRGIDVLSKKLGSPPDGPQAVTSTGGQHLFFKKPSGSKLNNSKGLMIDGTLYGIDIRTESPEGKLGNVVAAPSIGENGEPYRWLEELPPKEELPELPEAWQHFFDNQKQARGKAKVPNKNEHIDLSVPPWIDKIDTAEKIHRCENYLATVDPAIEGSGGHDRLFWAARVIFRGFLLSEVEGWPLLMDYCARCVPPFTDEAEIRHKWEEALEEKDFRKPKGWLLYNPEYCNNTNDNCYKSVSDLVDRLAAENARTVEGGDGQPTEEEHFPVEYYPPLIRDFCKNVADWMSVDVSVPGILVLTAASAAIGYSATLEQKDFDGAIRPIFHSAIVLDSGLGKSPIMKRMFAPHNKKNDEEHKKSKEKEIQITRENMGKKDKDKKKIPFVPPRIIKGTTIEGMQEVLSRIHNEALLSELGLTVNGETAKNFKKPGILWFYEEMAEMLESMNAFKNGKGDSSVICTILDGSGASTTRVDKEKNRYYPDCHVALAGGIQGDMLQDIADKNPQFFYQGLFQRMNFVVPPFKDQKADSPSLNPFLKENYDSTIGNLFDIGERVYSLSSEAEAVYLEYKKSCVEILNPLGRLGDSKTKAERAIMSATSKSKRTILIIALILEILKDETQEDIISGETMGGAVAIVKFLLNNFRRIANYCPKDGATKKNQVYNAIIKAGDSGLSRRDIQQRFFRGQGQGGKNLDDFLADLVAVYPDIKQNRSGNYINCP